MDILGSLDSLAEVDWSPEKMPDLICEKIYFISHMLVKMFGVYL